MVRRILLAVVVTVGFLFTATHTTWAQDKDSGRLVTVYDRGVEHVFVSKEETVGAALQAQGIELDAHDATEPAVEEEMVAANYWVNIYRARPIIVQDGATRAKIMAPYQSAEQVIKSANITFYSEDRVVLERSVNFTKDGAGLTLTIDRAIDFHLDLYGKKSVARTHEGAVGAMLEEKGITLKGSDRVSVSLEAPISAGMKVRVWREGKQTVTQDQPISYATEFVYDADRPMGYRAVKTPGVKGVRAVTYEIEIKDGEEVSRKEIARIVTAQPKKQQLTIGIKGLENGLTAARGALHSIDSKGVVHRETYYDLDMGVVMQSCGQGGRYSVRFDGMKIDADGYIIVAANYARYPKCSIVETSAGLGRVYDTGGFVLRHPDGFDLATDWTNRDGR